MGSGTGMPAKNGSATYITAFRFFFSRLSWVGLGKRLGWLGKLLFIASRLFLYFPTSVWDVPLHRDGSPRGDSPSSPAQRIMAPISLSCHITSSYTSPLLYTTIWHYLGGLHILGLRFPLDISSHEKKGSQSVFAWLDPGYRRYPPSRVFWSFYNNPLPAPSYIRNHVYRLQSEDG